MRLSGYCLTSLVTEVEPTLGPQLGITDDMLDSSPPANTTSISSVPAVRCTIRSSSPGSTSPGNTCARLKSATERRMWS